MKLSIIIPCYNEEKTILTVLEKLSDLKKQNQMPLQNIFTSCRFTFLVSIVFFVSGAIAGLAGFSEVTGIHYRLQQNISIGYGYTGIIIAWLAKNNPIGVILSAFFMSIVFVSTEVLQIEYGLPISMVYLYQGIILFTVLGADIFNEYQLRIRKLAT